MDIASRKNQKEIRSYLGHGENGRRVIISSTGQIEVKRDGKHEYWTTWAASVQLLEMDIRCPLNKNQNPRADLHVRSVLSAARDLARDWR